MTHPLDQKALEAATDALHERGDGWQPIETAPKDGTFVIICVSHETRDPVIGEARFLPATRFFDAEWWWQGCAPEQYINCEPISQTNFGKPTHWQPLPTPPGETG